VTRPSVGECAFCGDARPLDELTAVTPLSGLSAVFYVCRPTVSDRYCFRHYVGPASVFRIEAAQAMRAAA